MRRRTIALAGVVSLATTLVSRAQQTQRPVVGWLAAGPPLVASHPMIEALRAGLERTGFIDEQNVTLAFKFAGGRDERLAALATELISEKVAVIIAPTNQAALAARQASARIPIVFLTSDPVRLGLAESFNRPGGNATGMSVYSPELMPKRMEILRELLPTARIVTFLRRSAVGFSKQRITEYHAAARSVNLDLLLIDAGDAGEIEQAFARMAAQRNDALIVEPDPVFMAQTALIVSLVSQFKIPAMYDFRDYAIAGGLLVFGVDVPEIFRTLGTYVGQILGGANPADLPVQQPTKFQFVINIKTARALGIHIPPTILARANEVIE